MTEDPFAAEPGDTEAYLVDAVRQIADRLAALGVPIDGHSGGDTEEGLLRDVAAAAAQVQRLELGQGPDSQPADSGSQDSGSPDVQTPEVRTPEYKPSPAPKWWIWPADDPRRTAAIAKLRYWVDTVLLPEYGNLARKLPPCWAEHPTALHVLDPLSEMWLVLHIQPVRYPGHLGGQLEWHLRYLDAAITMIATEIGTCPVHPRAQEA